MMLKGTILTHDFTFKCVFCLTETLLYYTCFDQVSLNQIKIRDGRKTFLFYLPFRLCQDKKLLDAWAWLTFKILMQNEQTADSQEDYGIWMKKKVSIRNRLGKQKTCQAFCLHPSNRFQHFVTVFQRPARICFLWPA